MLKRWGGLVVLVAAATAVLDLVGAPAPFLLGALVATLVLALRSWAPEVPGPVGTFGQILIGISVGTLITADLFDIFAEHGGVVALALAGTLASSLAWGQVLRLQPGVSAVTASFASIAGGAAGVVATARDAGADQPVVATIQYLRILAVLFSIPVVAGILAPATTVAAGASDTGVEATWWSFAFTGCAVALGLLALRLLDFPGAAVLLPMLASAGLGASGLFQDVVVPDLLLNAGYVAIGVHVGGRFTPAAMRVIVRLLPLAVLQIVGTILTCGGIGYLLAVSTGIGHLDAYLATTPGGLYAVVAIAIATGADTGLVFSLQVLRLFAALLLVPVLARTVRGDSS